jgi:hypothetical protein
MVNLNEADLSFSLAGFAAAYEHIQQEAAHYRSVNRAIHG